MVTEQQIIKEMVSQLDFYASEYKEHQKFKELDIIINAFEHDAITYNILLERLFNKRPVFIPDIERYIAKREKEGWE